MNFRIIDNELLADYRRTLDFNNPKQLEAYNKLKNRLEQDH